MSAMKIVGWRRFHQLGGWMFASMDWPNNDPLAGDPEPLTPLAPAQAEIERLKAALAENDCRHAEMRARIEGAERSRDAYRDQSLANEEARLAAEEQVRVLSEALKRARVAMCSDAGPTTGDLEAIEAALQHKDNQDGR